MAVISFKRDFKGVNLPVTSLLLLAILIFGFRNLQAQDSLFSKKKLRESEVEALLSYYTQDGTHSAVTGGQGTEFLQVYSANINYAQTVNNRNTYTFHLGADVISSASTDRIDYVVSSASRLDQHSSLSIGYSRKTNNSGNELGGNLLFSLESDYTSVGAEVWMDHVSKDQSTGVTASVQAFADDLRWGRLKKPYITEAITLIYPAELRGQQWFDVYNRYSYNFSLALRKDLNKRMSLSLFPTYTFQHGLLSTPFHRVYFDDEILPRVENLPQQRNQAALGVQLNSFVMKRVVIRSFYQCYADDFGLSSNMLKLEVPVKVTPKLSLGPYMRYTYQEGSRYFMPFKQHSSDSQFYTSDYDLSTFWSANIGVNLNVMRGRETTQAWKLGGWSFRYSYYHRSDGLHAHIFSSYFGFGKKKLKTQQQ